MRTVFKSELLILIPETDAEAAQLTGWKADREGHVLAFNQNAGNGVAIRSLGLRDDVCREPINVTSRHPDPQVKLIGNLAATAFDLDGRHYASVEGFWQGLKFPKQSDRDRVAALSGLEAKRAGDAAAYGETVEYDGQLVVVGAWGHWQLMRLACEAKFTQNWEARSALLATGDRPLVHRVRKDSRTIPGVIMSEIWMRLRAKLRAASPLPQPEDEPDE